MEQKIVSLKADLARRERGRGKRYAPALKSRIAAAAAELRACGRGWQAIGGLLGIPHETVRRFAGAGEAGDNGFVPVEVVAAAESRLVVVTPAGYRLEGLTVADAAELLRRLR